MRVAVLTDNHAGSHTMAEHGLSYLIEHDGKRILFDTGQSDLFLRNAERMNTVIEKTDLIVLSHGHFDHGNGLSFLDGHELLCHPGCFVKRYRRKDNQSIGLQNTREELSARFRLITSHDPCKIAENIYFLGGIPRASGFESQSTTFILKDGSPDYVMDDSAVAFILPQGLFVVTGCGHSGIVNTLEHAKKVCGSEVIYGVMGGFHLKEQDTQLRETISYLKDNRVRHIMPSHCTGLPALSSFYENFRMPQVSTGDIFIL